MIVFDGVGKAFRNRRSDLTWVMRDMTVTLPDGINTGILAPRGQGKTTLINLASGNDSPSEGRVYRQGKVSYPWGSRNNISNRLTGRQNIRFLSDVYGRNFGDVYDFVEDFAQLGRYIDMPLKHYNTDLRSRLTIATMLGLDFDHLLVDELMEGGDNNFRKRCIAYLQDNAERLTLLIATSNTQIVQKYCQAAGVFNEGNLTFYDSVTEAIREFNKVNQVFV